MGSDMWKVVPGYPGYEVNCFGAVRCILRWKAPRILTPNMHVRGYMKVGVSLAGKTRTVFVHRLVALAFIPNPNRFPQVNHLNAVKTDNRPSNLEWVSPKLNSAHAMAHGLYRIGEKHQNVKLSDVQVMDIHKLKSDGHATKAIARRFGITPAATRRILQGKERKPVYSAMLAAASSGGKEG